VHARRKFISAARDTDCQLPQEKDGQRTALLKYPPALQEKVDESKVVEWTTLRDEKEAIRVVLPAQAKRIRAQKPDRIMTSRFVVTEKA
jgi:hypothetical protein